MDEKFTNNNGVKIQYWMLNRSSEKPPVIIVPGALSNATDICEAIEPYAGFYAIIVNLRGRGKSDTPLSGYSNVEHVSDIEAVIKDVHLNKYYLFGHSVGAGLASLCAVRNPEKVLGLIIADYPPAYPKFTDKWLERVTKSFHSVSMNLINGMVRDSKKENFIDALNQFSFPKLIIKGARENSLLSPEMVKEINENLKFSTLEIIENCGHEVFFEAPEETIRLIDKFML